jgi:hypothetical protein
MSTICMEFRNGGWPNFVILLLGTCGLGLAFAALGLTGARSQAARWAGVAAVLVAALTGGMGVLGVWFGHSMTNRALMGAGIRPTQVERIRREGYIESKSCAKFGVGLALLPLLAGAIAVLGGPRRRKLADATPPGAFGMNVAPSRDPEGSGVAVGLGAIAVAGLVLASDAVLIAQPLPGRERSPFEYELLDAKEMILDDGDLPRGCSSLERVLTDPLGSPGSAPQEVDVAALSAACADARLADIGKESPAKQRADLATLSKSPLLDRAHQKTVADQLAALGHAADGSGDSTKSSSPTVNGRLPPEIIQRIVRQNFSRMKRCYMTGLEANPNLEGRVVVRFVIGRDGNVSTATDGDSDLPDKTVRACVVAAFQALSFPQPESGIVTVVYPIVFKAG